MVSLRKIRQALYLSLLGVLGTALVLINPTYLLLGILSVFAILTLARNLNLYKIAMMIKRYAREAAKLRAKIRVMLHTGYRDYSSQVDEESRSHGRTYGYVR